MSQLRHLSQAVLLVGACAATMIGSQAASAAHLDPFGPAGNQSLVLDNYGGGETSPNRWPFVWWDLQGEYASGVLEFDLYMTNDDPGGVATKFWTYVNLRIGQKDGGLPGGSTNDTAIFDSFRVRSEVPGFFYNNASAASPAPFQHSTAHRVKYTIDGVAHTYTVEVNPLGNTGAPGLVAVDLDGAAGPNPATTTLPFKAGFYLPSPVGAGNSTFDTIAIGGSFGAVNGQTGSPFFIDNVSFVSDSAIVFSEDFESTPLGGVPSDSKFKYLGSAQGQGSTGYRVEVVGDVPEPGSACLLAIAALGLGRGRPRSRVVA